MLFDSQPRGYSNVEMKSECKHFIKVLAINIFKVTFKLEFTINNLYRGKNN